MGDDKVKVRESMETKISPERPMASKRKVQVSGIINGLTVKWWGAIGEITNDCIAGLIIGPPTLKEYAVEPVGVETINPSAQ